MCMLKYARGIGQVKSVMVPLLVYRMKRWNSPLAGIPVFAQRQEMFTPKADEFIQTTPRVPAGTQRLAIANPRTHHEFWSTSHTTPSTPPQRYLPGHTRCRHLRLGVLDLLLHLLLDLLRLGLCPLESLLGVVEGYPADLNNADAAEEEVYGGEAFGFLC